MTWRANSEVPHFNLAGAAGAGLLFTGVAGTYFSSSVHVPHREGFASSVKVSGSGGTAPTFTVTVQQSPDPDSVVDASATWYDLTPAHTLIAGDGSDFKAFSGRHFGRLRTKLVLGGTATPHGNVEHRIQ